MAELRGEGCTLEAPGPATAVPNSPRTKIGADGVHEALERQTKREEGIPSPYLRL
jgi:hypothetical protein